MKICVHFLCLSDVLDCGKLQIKVVVEIKTCFIKNKFFWKVMPIFEKKK